MSALESMKSTGEKKNASVLLDDGFISVAVKRSSSRSHLEKKGLKNSRLQSNVDSEVNAGTDGVIPSQEQREN